MPLSFQATPTLSSWEFDAADLSDQEIEEAGFGLLAPYGVELSIPPALLRSFVKEVRKRYLPNPYHNFLHALNVAQLVSMFDAEGLLERFEAGERFALLVAAFCHDIGHPGTDNRR